MEYSNGVFDVCTVIKCLMTGHIFWPEIWYQKEVCYVRMAFVTAILVIKMKVVWFTGESGEKKSQIYL